MIDFPILQRKVHDKRLAYLDNAATTHKPKQVLDAMTAYYETSNANVSRGLHVLGEESTVAYARARQTVARFLGITASQTVFTSGSTDGLNFVARYAEQILAPGDEILLSVYEHHSNIVPWQVVAQKTGAKIVYCGLTQDFEFDADDFTNKLSEKTKFVCISHASNVLGTLTPIDTVIKQAHDRGALVVIDGAQAVGHFPFRFTHEPDFYVFSAHKMLGPQGIGVLALGNSMLKKLSPFRFGGGMILTVSEDAHTLAEPPECFEAGTPNVAGAVGLAAAINYIEHFGLAKIHAHEAKLTLYAYELLQKIPQVTIYGPKPSAHRAGIISFTVEGIHPHDIAQILDSEGVAIRSGMHCAMPLHHALGVDALNRISLALYNTQNDVYRAVEAIKKAIEVFA